jgi:FSR family fosmidomycin resistance protein-like MFS transporter
MTVIPAVLPFLIAHHDLSYFLAGLLVTIYNIASSMTQPLFGWLADSRGFMIPLVLSVTGSAIFISLMGFTDSFPLLALCAGIAALGHGSFHPIGLSCISRFCTDQNRGRVLSYFVVGGNIGFALGPVLAGIALAVAGLQGMALLLLPALVLVPVLRRIHPDLSSRQNPENEIHTEDPHPSHWPFLLLMFASTFRAWGLFGVVAFLPAYMVQLGYPVMSADLSISFMLIGGVIGQVVGGRLSDHYGRKEFVLAALGLSIPCFYGFLLLPGIYSLASLLLFGFWLWSTFSVTVAMSHELLPNNIGLASGSIMGVVVGAGGIGVALNGMLADQSSLLTAMMVLPVTIAVSVILFLVTPYPLKIGRQLTSHLHRHHSI